MHYFNFSRFSSIIFASNADATESYFRIPRKMAVEATEPSTPDTNLVTGFVSRIFIRWSGFFWKIIQIIRLNKTYLTSQKMQAIAN